MNTVRVRFAPSPTGFLHIGGLRTALFNYLFARHNKGVFILRIEDTDRTRFVEGAIENLILVLNWVGINYDEGPFLNSNGKIFQKGDFGPYIQSERLKLYQEYANFLLEKGYAYRCFCSAERLDEVRKQQMLNKQPPRYDRKCRNLSKEESEKLSKELPFTIRMVVPEQKIMFNDIIRGEVVFDGSLIDDQVLLKSDGFPTYHLANVVDDHLMKITHVIRGEEWLSSTPKHILLYKYFGWESPIFAHLPLLLNPDRSKLSKRSGDVAVEDYRRDGYLPEALLNYVALLGWSTEDSQQFFTKEELIEKFSLERCSQSPAVFDKQKLLWMNGEYIRKTEIEKLFTYAKPFLEEAKINIQEEKYIRKLIQVEQEKIKLLKDIPHLIDYFLCTDEELVYNDTAVKKFLSSEKQKEVLIKLYKTLNNENDFSKENLEKVVRDFCVNNNCKTTEVFHPLRVAVSGRTEGPGLFDLLSLLGKEKVLKRLVLSIKKFFGVSEIN